MQPKHLLQISLCASVISTTCILGTASAAPVALNPWTQESYPAVAGFGAGVWTVSGSGDSVYQSVNGQPTLFYSNFNAINSDITGTIRVTGGDDDYIGFALGFMPGDTSNATADYLLVDWKKAPSHTTSVHHRT